MDVIFETQKGRSFVVEVGFFDSVLEIKQKIHKYHHIPVAKQTLIFDRRVLSDAADIAECGLLHNSRVRLLVAADRAEATLKLKIAGAGAHVLSLQLDLNDTTVASLKERILRKAEFPAPVTFRSLSIQLNGSELVQEQRSLADCGLSEGSELEVALRPVAAAKKTMRIAIMAKCGSRKITVEVNPSDSVGELRKVLQKLNQSQNHDFQLPPEGYFFIFKQNVMDDDRSFRWHHVGHGDTIEIFNGSVTGGS